MNNMSLVEIAYQVLKDRKRPMDFTKLFNEVMKKKGLSESNSQVIVDFYTKLTVDGRFMCLEKNTWTLKEFLSSSQLPSEDLDVEEEDNIEAEVEEEEADEYSDFGGSDYSDEPSKLDIDYDEGDREEDDSESEEDY